MPTTTVDGTTLGYTDGGGEGPAVLLVHAFPLHGGMWEPQMDALGGRTRMIAVDLKGFGSSDAPEDHAVYTMDSYADEVAGVLDHLGLQQVVFCGLSMGGYIGFSFLRRHRDRLAGFVLADTRAEADPPEGIEKRTNQQQQVRETGTSDLVEALSGALLSPKTLENKPDVVERAKKLMDNPAAGFIGALEAMKQRPDSTEDLAAIDVPTLVLVGENDAITPVDASRKIHEHVRGSRLVVIPEAGHLSNLESPDAFNGALGEFFMQLT
jgi:3-oxoadipate enol-lactonase